MGTPFLFRQERGKEARPDPPSSTLASVLAIYVSQPPRGRTVGSGPVTNLKSHQLLLVACALSGSHNTSMGDQFNRRVQQDRLLFFIRLATFFWLSSDL